MGLDERQSNGRACLIRESMNLIGTKLDGREGLIIESLNWMSMNQCNTGTLD